MAEYDDEESEVEDKLNNFLKSGGCGHAGDFDPENPRIRKCCVIAFICGAQVQMVYPETIEDCEEEEEEDEEAPE
jgi:hypothetical protein